MGRGVHINVDALEYDVKPQIKNISKYLELGSGSLASISIPSDFSYRSKLINISQVVTDINNRVNSIGNWLNTQINNFSDAEHSNKGLMENLGFSSLLSSMDGNTYSFGANGDIALENNSFYDEVKSSIISALDFVFSGEWIIDAADMMKKTASKVVDGIESVFTEIGEGLKSFGIAFWDGFTATAASVVNIVAGLLKGLCQLVGALLDFIIMLLVGADSIVTGIIDGITYLIALAEGDTENWNSITARLWKNTMTFVAEEHVENAYKSFYDNTLVGQWLDENAVGICKSDGFLTNVASGIGYVAGVVILTIATLGIGTAATGAAAASTATSTAVSAGIAGAAGAGKATQEIWGEMRDSSWAGVWEMYQKGEISLEQYNEYAAIRNLSNEEWELKKKAYINGLISKNDFEQMKQIREMPEDWTTFENGIKGIGYGTAVGAWEGVQWYAGGKLGNMTFSSSKLGDSILRVIVDTEFNMMDSPFRSALDTIATDKTFNEAFESRGGLESMLVDAGIGLIGSTGGEAFDGISSGFVNSIEMNNRIKFSERKMIEYFNEKPNLGISEERVREAFGKIISCKTNKEFDDIYRQYSPNVSDDYLKGVLACHIGDKGGMVVLRPKNTVDDIIHEINHDLGNVYGISSNLVDPQFSSRGIDEAITERLALKISGTNGCGTSSYGVNVKYLNRIIESLEKVGYKDFDAMSYYTNSTSYLATTLNQIVGDNSFYEELISWMDIADGQQGKADKALIAQAKITIEGLINTFENKIGGITWKSN